MNKNDVMTNEQLTKAVNSLVDIVESMQTTMMTVMDALKDYIKAKPIQQ